MAFLNICLPEFYNNYFLMKFFKVKIKKEDKEKDKDNIRQKKMTNTTIQIMYNTLRGNWYFLIYYYQQLVIILFVVLYNCNKDNIAKNIVTLTNKYAPVSTIILRNTYDIGSNLSSCYGSCQSMAAPQKPRYVQNTDNKKESL